MKSAKIRKRLGITAAIIGLMLIVLFAILFFNSESIELSQNDKVYLRRFLSDWQIQARPENVHRDFESEYHFISIIQDKVLANLTGEQIPHAFFGNVRYYYQNRQGICYDRAVLIEKILLLYHFPFRHAYLYFGKNRTPSMTDFFKTQLKSHAALEVNTEKGWMAVGTNANWLGIDSNGKPLDFHALSQELRSSQGNPHLLKAGSSGTSFWKVPGYHFRILYGLYSRHGDFFTGDTANGSRSLFTGHRHVLPDYNLRMLLYNFWP